MKSSGMTKYGELQPYIDILKELEQRQAINNVDVDYDDNYYDGNDVLRTTFNVVDPDDPETIRGGARVELVIDAVDSWMLAREDKPGYYYGNEYGDSAASFKKRITSYIRDIVSEFTPFRLSDETNEAISRKWLNTIYSDKNEVVTMGYIFNNLSAKEQQEIKNIAEDNESPVELILAYIIRKESTMPNIPIAVCYDNDRHFALGFAPSIKKWAEDNLKGHNYKLMENLEKPGVSKADKITDFIEDLYDLRKSSIANEGEYGLGNLVFKEMRALGYLDNLRKLKNEIVDKELSLENLN